MLRRIFSFQNPAFVFGRVPCLGQPCQKQPSTNTATLASRNTKSGFPNSGCLLRQPVIPCNRRKAINASSVSLFPWERMRDMTSERFVLEKTSAMGRNGGTLGV